jgi:hypothetical protein
MNKLIVFLVVVFILNEANGQKNIYPNAVRFIYNSDCLKNDSVLNNRGKYDIYVSPEIIPFNLNSVESSILRLDYIDNYNEFANYSKEQEKIIKKVNDSLMFSEKLLNKSFQNKIKENLNKLTTGGNIKYILFFSNIVNNRLYAEVIPYDNLTFKDFKIETVSFGKVYSYLFVISDKGEFLKVYTGEIFHN